MDRRMVSKDVGRKGDRLADIFLAVKALPFALLELGGDATGGKFCIRFDRLGVVDGDSIYAML
jgi:hypothetical protein